MRGAPERRPDASPTGAGIHAPLLSADEIAALAHQATLLARTRPRREVHDHHAGDWPSATLGRGLDFEEARPYSPGDDIRDMDWRTTARLGHPFVKTYREERQPVLHLVADRGPAMRFGTRRRLKAAQAARIAALGAFAAIERNIAVAASLWDEPDRDLPPRHGRAGLIELVRALAEAAPPLPPRPAGGKSIHTSPQAPGYPLPPWGEGGGEGAGEARMRPWLWTTADLAGCACPPSPPPLPLEGEGTCAAHTTEECGHSQRLHRLLADLPRGTRVLILSDFAWLDEHHAALLAQLAARADLTAVRILDPAERALPDLGLARFIDLAAGRVRWIDTGSAIARRAHAEACAARLAAQAASLARAGAALIDVAGDTDDLIPVLMDHA